MEKIIICTGLLLFGVGAISVQAQDFTQYAETKTLRINGEVYAIQKMSRKDNHIKVKYFAEKDNSGTVYQRYTKWAATRKVMALSSGTYMSTCDVYSAKPVGLCIDNGRVVNESLEDKMDGLIIVYATGGLVSTNLKNGNLTITLADNTKKTVNIRNNPYDRAEFIKWAKEQQATVFQTHLFVSDNTVAIANNSSTVAASRRFLAVCKKGTDIFHYIINLPAPSTLLDGTNKAYNYLTKYENVTVSFMINLDTGCQDVLRLYNKDGIENTSKNFRGQLDPSAAVNLLVYYFE